MRYAINPYILPVMEGDVCIGQGFIADGYFITITHLVKEHPDCYIVTDRDKKFLCKYKYHYGRRVLDADYVGGWNYGPKAEQIDVVMYKVPGIDSPLHLNMHEPLQKEVFKNHCVDIIFDPETNIYSRKFSVEDALVVGTGEGCHFYCRCKRSPKSSGSPLLWENQVIGILCYGSNQEYLCSFLKVNSFLPYTGIEVQIDKAEIINRLLPSGIDRTMAICILYALNGDVSMVGIDLEQEGIYETGYYACLRRLSFDMNTLLKKEKEVLEEYCIYVISNKI